MAAYHLVDGLVMCRLPACTPGSAPAPMLGNKYGRTLAAVSYRKPTNVDKALKV